MKLAGPMRTVVSCSSAALLFAAVCLAGLSCGSEPGRSNGQPGDPLTEEERLWLDAHPVITVAPDPVFPPVEFYDVDGVLRGIAPEYLDLIGQRLGVEFEYIRYENWEQVILDAMAKRVDMLSAASPSPQREEYLLFTEPHTVIAGILINLQSGEETLSIDELEGMRVATVSGYVWQDYIENEYPEIDLVLVPDINTGIHMVSFGEVDVFVMDRATASWVIEEMAVTNLNMAGETGWYTSLSFAIRDDWPLFRSIMDKGLAMVTEEEREAIYVSWVRLGHSEAFYNKGEFWEVTFIALGSVLLVIVLILLWNRSLRREVVQRTRELENELSEKLRLEDQLRQAQKMEAIGRLAGGVAHDFNNILQAILGNITLAEEDLSPDDIHYIQLEEIRKAADRAALLTRQLLAFGRRQTLQKSRLDIFSLIENLLSMVERVIGENIKMESASDPDLWPVLADQSQMEQVLMNLCVNARDAMPRGGLLNLKAMNVTLDRDFVVAKPWAREGEFVIITVSDTGEGMEREIIERIFDPFFTTKEAGKGTGLGLATVYGIISQHMGMIDVDSAVGIGSTFSIYLPALRSDDAAQDEPALEAPIGGAETVLLAEDEDSVRFMLVEVLRAAGYRVLSAGNGREALRLLAEEQGRVSVAVLDVVMPGMNGFKVHDIVRKQFPHVRTLFISGYSHHEFKQSEVTGETVSILQKPFHTDDLLTRIREIIDGSQS